MAQQSQVHRQTLQLCQLINEKCQIPSSSFSYDILKTKSWYIEILELLCPYLIDQLAAARRQHNQAKAINQILSLINNLDEFNEDVTQTIKGANIVSGDPIQIYYIVQVFAALLEEAMKEEQFEEQAEDGSEEATIQSPQHNPFANYRVQNRSNLKSHSDNEQNQGRHSVIGIKNQFEKDQESQLDSEFQIKKQKPIIQTIHPHFQQTTNQKSQQKPAFQVEQPISSDGSNDQYLSQKLSETKMKKKGYKVVKNPEHNQLIYGKKKPKQLVAHPNIKNIEKAKGHEAVKLTKQITNKIKSPKKISSPKNINRVVSPSTTTIKKKKKQLQYYHKDFKTHKKQMKQVQKSQKIQQVKSDSNLHKMLNWRQQKLKTEQRQYEESLKMRLQTQKELYLKKMNNMLLEMERKKDIDEKKLFQQKLMQQNQMAMQRMQALENFYQDRICLLKENKKSSREERRLIATGHKQIIHEIEKKLKKQNDEKILKLTEKYRHESELIQTDFAELEQKIIKAYKKK